MQQRSRHPGVERVRVAVHAFDALTRGGLTRSLDGRDDLVVAPDRSTAQAVVLAVDRMDRKAVDFLKTAGESGPPVVLITDLLEEQDLMFVLEHRVVAVLPRSAATGDRLAHGVIAAARGGGVLPPALLGGVLRHVERMRRELAEHGSPTQLNTRELEVLRLVADGWSTVEIADRIAVSERTVKNAVTSLTTKLNLRNRSHAVAYAVRAGII
ncbi:LuxR C-terminal-related transcriptional regulator [Saccharothrix sp. Mg75]|uniref:helix-turn-helix transcriptional regulator n=1 Tax=Saccharothrix sp. Mg75 TaxID=3445357 RepID=UPI003EEC1CC3